MTKSEWRRLEMALDAHGVPWEWGDPGPRNYAIYRRGVSRHKITFSPTLQDCPDSQVRAVVYHELGHAHTLVSLMMAAGTFVPFQPARRLVEVNERRADRWAADALGLTEEELRAYRFDKVRIKALKS